MISLIAVLISAVSLIRTGKLHKQQIILNELTEKLSRKQLDNISKAESEKSKTKIFVDLIKENNDYFIRLTNTGNSLAKDVSYEVINDSDNYGYLEPIPIIHPGQSIKFLFAIYFGSPDKYNVKVEWVNSDNSESKDEFFLVV